MNTDINGHTNRTIRANKLWEKWKYQLEVKHMSIKEIARRSKKSDGKPYDPKYVSRILSNLRKIKNYSDT